VFDMTGRLADLVGGLPSKVQSVKISETMRPETGSFSEARGLWTGTKIIIKRSELASVDTYASTLLHEIAHARSGETDITIGFEQELTSLLGIVASKALRRASADPELPQTTSRDPARAKKVGFWERLFGNPSR
jgi:hypothetical protein